jgi:hypothetical protein
MVLLIAAMTAVAQDPTILQIRILEGEGAVYATGSRATRGITVLVTGETGKPVDGATVSFRLPVDGPTGTFATGSKTEIVTTRADGRAAVWGMPWNRTAGKVEIRITTAKGEARAGTVCPIYLSDAISTREAAPSGRVSSHPARSRKWLWVTLAVVGAVGGGVAATGLSGKPSTASASASVLRIGSPAGINLGRP